MATRRLYLDDSYRTNFTAIVEEAIINEEHIRVRLNETFFYPTSGGQNNDTGSLGGYQVIDVVEEGPLIWHVVENKDEAIDAVVGTFTPGRSVSGEINWTRRFDHMQQHSGQHLVSAILETHFGVKTTSVHLGQSTYIDFDNYENFNAQHFRQAETLVAKAVFENRPVTVEYEESSPAGSITARVRATHGSSPKKEKHGPMRYIVIEGIDRNGCCGTHVSRTGDIGPLLFLSAQKYRGGSRITYVLGQRCIDTIQEHRDALTELGALLKANPPMMPTLVNQLLEKAQVSRKECESLKGQLAGLLAEKMILSTPIGEDGLRRIIVEKDEVGDLERAMSSTAKLHPGTVFIAIENVGAGPYKCYMAAAPDTKIQCGKAVKTLIANDRGRGGGRPEQAQCSLTEKLSASEIMEIVVQCRE